MSSIRVMVFIILCIIHWETSNGYKGHGNPIDCKTAAEWVKHMQGIDGITYWIEFEDMLKSAEKAESALQTAEADTGFLKK